MSKKSVPKTITFSNFIIATVVVALLAGAVGYVAGMQKTDKTAKTDHSSDMPMKDMHANGHSESDEHSHGMFMVNQEQAPMVDIEVEKDAKKGWNVSIQTTKFTFTPEDVNQANIIGEGHAHLYVDGKKVARVYVPNFHYDKEFDGAKTFKVTLNANDHSDYMVGGNVISAEKDVSHMSDM